MRRRFFISTSTALDRDGPDRQGSVEGPQPFDSNCRNASRVLAACQALYTSSVSIDLTLTGLVGHACRRQVAGDAAVLAH
jgi:hypothetical protein